MCNTFLQHQILIQYFMPHIKIVATAFAIMIRALKSFSLLSEESIGVSTGGIVGAGADDSTGPFELLPTLPESGIVYPLWI